MKPAAFDYHAPETADEAVHLLAELGDEAKFIAGGQSLMPLLVLRLAVFDHLVDLRRLTDLADITAGTDTVRIGATTTHTMVGRSETIARSVPLLARATPLIGHFQIRNRGTMGVGDLGERITAPLKYPQLPSGNLIEQPGEIPLQPLRGHEWQQCEAANGLVLREQALQVRGSKTGPAQGPEHQLSAGPQGFEA